LLITVEGEEVERKKYRHTLLGLYGSYRQKQTQDRQISLILYLPAFVDSRRDMNKRIILVLLIVVLVSNSHVYAACAEQKAATWWEMFIAWLLSLFFGISPSSCGDEPDPAPVPAPVNAPGKQDDLSPRQWNLLLRWFKLRSCPLKLMCPRQVPFGPKDLYLQH
jgi:hypothetical protein